METRQTTSIELTHDERTLLGEVLESAYRNLRQEIGSTEGTEFRRALKAREEMLHQLLEKLGGGPAR